MRDFSEILKMRGFSAGETEVVHPARSLSEGNGEAVAPPPQPAEKGSAWTLKDLPELEEKMRAAGWRVTRRGNELICRSARGLGVQ
jgi:hypothetical protein